MRPTDDKVRLWIHIYAKNIIRMSLLSCASQINEIGSLYQEGRATKDGTVR
jgi:hypothetical protein